MSRVTAADVSIYDYANANVSGKKGRISKAIGTPVVEVQRLTKNRHDLGWELRLDDGDAVGDFDLRRDTSGTENQEDSSRPYLTLPMDIWFAIGDHIAPEDVKAFASVCRSSQKVTNSARFWFGLYNRYCKSLLRERLPQRLLPQRVTALHGLRANVVCSLFFVYPPFVERLKPRLGNECDLQPIFRRKCISTWYTTKGKTWIYWFKLKQMNPRAGRCTSLSSSMNKKLLQIEKDMAANMEKDSKVLQVSCSQYLPLPAVHGLVLTRALTTVSQDMMAHKLSLHFDNGSYIVFDPATSIQILEWWHPQYPHTSLSVKERRKGLFRNKNDTDNIQIRTISDNWYDIIN